MASASFRSDLVLDPWTALMAQAWPRANGMPSARQVSASRYQVWTHSHPTKRSGRNGAMAARNGSGRAGRPLDSRTVPAWSRTQAYSVLAWRSTPTYDAAVWVRKRTVKTPAGVGNRNLQQYPCAAADPAAWADFRREVVGRPGR